ncbi:MAG: hypothetical protein K2J50_04750, partial [Treponemataceae bacterium]|nr:hypothetical protein [Treponemataceae bacterium]
HNTFLGGTEMMKKLSKIALLAAASAFMLAVFPACGDDDGNDDPKATLAAEAVELEVGKGIPVEATVTVENDTFSTKAKEIQPNGEIPITYFELKAGANVTVSAATLKTWNSDTKATITFTVTATEGAEKGTITAEIKKGTLTNTEALTTAGNIAYTIKGTGNEQVGGNIDPVIWKISDYLSKLGSEENNAKKLSELGFTDGAECGIATLGANVKVRSDGTGVSNTVTDGVTGYCQLSNGKAGSLLLTVPAGTVKITLGAKNANRALAIYDSTYTTPLKAFNEEPPSNYADFVYEHTFGEETQVYVTSVGGTTNFKALKLE